ncbi:nicotinamidase, putative [Trypanosoma equiperdum]|uniref:nicotinamidase n=3 Tax=Trypanozoon TaxID=39700 RepID=Q38FD5_TRYB2|nr:pyrazinamidase/nicotinamidase, putative [Trypanosoma brucei gambiense DAL972]XP_803697.1 alpha/beta-hydrolase-like protein [Trypanosoma brucei brucei TREU927]XP_803704.1 pyrazinamidase/nicotinamidase, putative [Trypanosoma brucei brucei TREU927]SCU72209.1 nicotinamidase, putative [Trypanosoma equiperdum]EAN76480.1 alpha/beta-hydrolase-like protein [Trypanosoma brucei brucei TREU927]EAN76485.1 pyrazinamidase/nicotinamidase, putative [Trypanosoma brucei brucei TREU927]CBH14135.1 pyrazinamida|eukprot:XP_011776406.1 pyrazinamidase/nicotinamidase, putative [Trypanosoma brucei gambiense DAL972]
MSTSRITLSSQHDALIIVDMQNDFVLPDGALSVTGATEIIPIINRVVGDHQFRAVVASMDWHPPGHMSFRNEDGTGGPWPPHCVRSTTGAQLHSEMKQGEITHLIHKATSLDSESYSAFSDDSGKTTGLAAMLRAMDVRRVFMCGVASDYCVYFTSLHAIQEEFTVVVLEDAVRPVDPVAMEKKRAHLEKEGVIFARSTDLSSF